MNHREVLEVLVACRINVSLQLWDTRSFTLPFPTWWANSQEKTFIMRKEKGNDCLGWFWNAKALGAWCRTLKWERPQQCRGGESEMTWCDKRLRPKRAALVKISISRSTKGTAQGAEDAEAGGLSLHLRFRACCPWGRAAAHNRQLLLVQILSNGTSAWSGGGIWAKRTRKVIRK